MDQTPFIFRQAKLGWSLRYRLEWGYLCHHSFLGERGTSAGWSGWVGNDRKIYYILQVFLAESKSKAIYNLHTVSYRGSVSRFSTSTSSQDWELNQQPCGSWSVALLVMICNEVWSLIQFHKWSWLCFTTRGCRFYRGDQRCTGIMKMWIKRTSLRDAYRSPV